MKFDKRFKKRFKLSFIKSLKLGFNIDDIKKRLKEQSYPSDLINKLLEELKTDKGIAKSFKKKPELKRKPSLLEKIKKKLFKLNEEAKIKQITKIHSIYYNLIIEGKRRLNQEQLDITSIIDNPENKKLINYFIESRKNKIKTFLKKLNSLRSIIKRLKEVEIKPQIKMEFNKIIDFVNIEEDDLTKETQDLDQIKASLEIPDQLKILFKDEKTKLELKEKSLQKIINQISKKSPKFKEVISQF